MSQAESNQPASSVSSTTASNRSDVRRKLDMVEWGCITIISGLVVAWLLLFLAGFSYLSDDEKSRLVIFNKLKKLGMALHNHVDVNGALPEPGTLQLIPEYPNASQLSWRVHLLPFLGEEELYSRFHLDEPWDSSHNLQLLAEMPDAYRLPDDSPDSVKTAFVGLRLSRDAATELETMWTEGHARKFREVTDRTSNSLLVVALDSQHAVHWTKPADFELDWEDPGLGLPENFYGALADGSARQVTVQTSDDVRRALCFINDGAEVLER